MEHECWATLEGCRCLKIAGHSSEHGAFVRGRWTLWFGVRHDR